MVVVRATTGYSSRGSEMNEQLSYEQIRSPHIPDWPLSWHVSGTNGPGLTVTILANLQRKKSGLF